MEALESHYSPHELASQRVNYLLFLHRLTQKELALSVGISPVQLNKKMNGVSRWAVEDLIAIADRFDVDINYMIGRLPIETALRRDKKSPVAIATGDSEVARPEGFEPPTF